MNRRVCSRAIIVDEDKILTLFRRKRINDDVKEYYSLPGGGQENGESLEENVIREVKEELSIDISILGYLGQVEDDKSITHFFHCQRVKGIPILGGPEKLRNSDENHYEVRYLKLDDLHKENIYYIDIINRAVKHDYLIK